MSDEPYFSHVNYTMPSSATTKFYKGLTGYKKQVIESIYPANGADAVEDDGTTSDSFSSDNLLVGVGWAYNTGGSATATGNSVLKISVTDGGSGYTSAPIVSFIGGDGSGASATAEITGGVVRSVTVTSRGSGYTSSPTVFFSGDGSGATAIASLDISLTNASSFKGSRISLRSKKNFTDADDPREGEAPYSYYRFDNRGLLYGIFLGGRSFTTKPFASAPDAQFFTSAADFDGADQNPPINWLGCHQSSPSVQSTWFPSQIKGDLIYNHAAGHRYFHEEGDEVKWYQANRTFSRYGPYDELVFLNHPINGSSVRSVSVTAPGSGYTSAPIVSFNGGDGSGASATANISGGAVTSVTVTSGGSGYTSSPSVSFEGGDGSGAAASAQVPADVETYFMMGEESTFAGGKWPSISLRTSGVNAATAQAYGSPNLSLILSSDLYPTTTGLQADPNPETQFSNKRFGTQYSFATGTQVALTEKKRVFNLGPSFSYTFAAAEPSAATEWKPGADIERDSKKLFEDIKSDKRELGGSVSYHYGDTYSYKKGNSRDVFISGKETTGGLTAYGIEKQSETKMSNGGLIQEKVQRCATQEDDDGPFVPFKTKTEGASFHQTSTNAMAKSESFIGIKVEDLATTAKTSTNVSAMSINTKVPPLSLPGLGKVWPSLEASASTGLVGGEVKIYGLKMKVMFRPVGKFLSLFSKGNESVKLFALVHDEGHLSVQDLDAKATAMVLNTKLDVQATKAANNVGSQLNELNNKAEAALSKINTSVSNTKGRAVSAKQKTVQAVNLANQASIEASMIGTQILQLKT